MLRFGTIPLKNLAPIFLVINLKPLIHLRFTFFQQTLDIFDTIAESLRPAFQS
jgi:hypothetical protein